MPDTPRVTRCARWALLGYALALGAVLLSPEPTVAADVVRLVGEWLRQLGPVGANLEPKRVEAALNAAMFVPLSALAVLALPKLRWQTVSLLAFGVSLAAEVFQRLALDARSAQLVDVVANTVGAILGAALAVAVQRLASWSER